jgi:hypothetical protein
MHTDTYLLYLLVRVASGDAVDCPVRCQQRAPMDAYGMSAAVRARAPVKHRSPRCVLRCVCPDATVQEAVPSGTTGRVSLSTSVEVRAFVGLLGTDKPYGFTRIYIFCLPPSSTFIVVRGFNNFF